MFFLIGMCKLALLAENALDYFKEMSFKLHFQCFHIQLSKKKYNILNITLFLRQESKCILMPLFLF